MHQGARHIVGDDRGLDAFAHELPCRQACALQERSRLVGDHRHLLALLDGAANHAQGRAVAGGRERPCIAVRENPGAGRHHVGAKRAHRPAARNILVVNGL